MSRRGTGVIHRQTIKHPETGAELTFYTSTLSVHRATTKLLAKNGYKEVSQQEDLADIQSAEEALDVVNHLMPIEKG